MTQSIGWRLEQYTLKKRQEVLLVHLETPTGEPDTVMIYAGFSSSLMQSTAFDPDIPVIAADATINSIDRLVSPYDPSDPQYLATDISLVEMTAILDDTSL